jgi:hypothetical protein
VYLVNCSKVGWVKYKSVCVVLLEYS